MHHVAGEPAVVRSVFRIGRNNCLDCRFQRRIEQAGLDDRFHGLQPNHQVFTAQGFGQVSGCQVLAIEPD
jgi:hypothetical protein